MLRTLSWWAGSEISDGGYPAVALTPLWLDSLSLYRILRNKWLDRLVCCVGVDEGPSVASMPTKRNLGLVGREKLLLPENSHAIPVDQFCMRLKNVGIATVGFQSLNNGEGNCMRHLWGTM